MAENKLSFEEYKSLVEQAPIMIWRSDTTAKCDYFNERWLSFTGRSMEQEYGDGWTEGVHPEDYQRRLDIYMAAFPKREIFEMEYRLRRHDGNYRWIFDRGVPFFNSKGEFAGYIGSCIDVTEKVAAQAAVEKAQVAKVKELRGLLPICASCKKIRDDKGYWKQIEVYISEHSEAEFSHGICPNCANELYPEIFARLGQRAGKNLKYSPGATTPAGVPVKLKPLVKTEELRPCQSPGRTSCNIQGSLWSYFLR